MKKQTREKNDNSKKDEIIKIIHVQNETYCAKPHETIVHYDTRANKILERVLLAFSSCCNHKS